MINELPISILLYVLSELVADLFGFQSDYLAIMELLAVVDYHG